MLPVVVKLCFRTRGAMLSDTWSYAFGHGKLCFWTRKTMLLRFESYAFGVGELCFSHLGAMLFAVASHFGEAAGLSSYGM